MSIDGHSDGTRERSGPAAGIGDARTAMARRKRATLLDSVGAAVAGAGAGALSPVTLHRLAPLLLAVGGGVHAWGMWETRRLERAAGKPTPWWAEALYWACWILPAALATVVW